MKFISDNQTGDKQGSLTLFLSSFVSIWAIFIWCGHANADTTQISAEELFNKLSASKGYTFQIIGEIPNENKITYKLQEVKDARETIKNILKQLNINSYLLYKDESTRTIKIIIPEDQGNNTIVESDSHDNKTAVITPEMVLKIKEKHKLAMDSRSDDTIITAPSADGPGLTLGEWKKIKREYKEQQANKTDMSEISTSPDDNSPLTLGELKEIKENHKLALEARSDYEEITAPSADGPGLTLGEWKAIKQQNRLMNASRSDSDYVLPPSEDGPGITRGEIRDIKQKYKENLQTKEAIIAPLPVPE